MSTTYTVAKKRKCSYNYSAIETCLCLCILYLCPFSHPLNLEPVTPLFSGITHFRLKNNLKTKTVILSFLINHYNRAKYLCL